MRVRIPLRQLWLSHYSQISAMESHEPAKANPNKPGATLRNSEAEYLVYTEKVGISKFPAATVECLLHVKTRGQNG